MNKELKEPFYVAEVGTALQKALVDNFEAQEQLKEVINKTVQITEEKNFGGWIGVAENPPLNTTVLCEIKWFTNNSMTYEVLRYVNADDYDWETTDGNEISNNAYVVAWKHITPPPRISLITNKSDINK